MAHKDNAKKNDSKHEELRYFCGGMKRINLVLRKEDFDENGYYKYKKNSLRFEYNALDRNVNVFLMHDDDGVIKNKEDGKNTK